MTFPATTTHHNSTAPPDFFGGLSVGQKVAIGLGTLLAVALVVGIIVLIVRKIRSRKQRASYQPINYNPDVYNLDDDDDDIGHL